MNRHLAASRPRPLSSHQRGLGLIGLLFYAVIIAMVAIVGMKVFPTYLEYIAIQRAVAKSVVGATTPADVARAFDRSAAIDDITSITGKDVVVTKNGDQLTAAFSYEKRLPLVGPASLLLEYKGESRR